ncbi:MAG: hypothetical protein AB7Q01_01075 [Gammaproteobacteria bacterium]
MPSSARVPQRAKKSGQLLFALIICLLLSNVCADEAYDLGIDAFNRGDYEAAVAHFLASQTDAAESALLHYNLGASYYKLARYLEARESFLEVIAEPELAALGYYNLALVSIKLNQPDQVAVWLQRAVESADNPKLRNLALTLLARYSDQRDADRTPAGTTAPVTSPWSGYIVGESGYDSNVILRADNQTLVTSEQDDFFLDAFAHLNRRIGETAGGLRMNLEGSVYVIKYQDIKGYDTDSLRIGGSLEMNLAGWLTLGRTQLVYSLLDGDEFTLESQFNLNASRWLDPGRSRLRLRYEMSRINDLDPLYSYLSGWRHNTDVGMTWLREEQQMYLMYQLETNYREELDAPRFTSYSPVRNSLRIGVESPAGRLVNATFEMRYYHSHYLNPNELADGSFLTRNDDRFSVIARLAHGFSGGNELFFEYRRTDNRSNIDDYDYKQYMAMLGLLVSF